MFPPRGTLQSRSCQFRLPASQPLTQHLLVALEISIHGEENPTKFRSFKKQARYSCYIRSVFQRLSKQFQIIADETIITPNIDLLKKTTSAISGELPSSGSIQYPSNSWRDFSDCLLSGIMVSS